MIIIVSFTNFQNDLKAMMQEIADRLSVVRPIIDYKSNLIEIKLQTHKNILILVKPGFPEYIKGTRPDYYWTNSYDVDNYYRHCHDVKCLQNFSELINLVLTECQKDEEKWRNCTMFMTAGSNLSEKIKNYKDGTTKKVPIGIKCFRAGDAWERTSVVIVTEENQMEVSMFWNSLYFDNEHYA